MIPFPPSMSFVRGGRRQLASLDPAEGVPGSLSLWALSEGQLALIQEGVVVAGPFLPNRALTIAQNVLAGREGAMSQQNMTALALTVAALAVKLADAGEPSGSPVLADAAGGQSALRPGAAGPGGR